MQCGPDALYWLANPRDPEVWSALDRWNADGQMTLAAQFNDRDEVLVLNSPLTLNAQAERFRPIPGADERVEDYINTVAELCLRDCVVHMVTSDLPGQENLRHVQPCMVTSAICGRVAISEQR